MKSVSVIEQHYARDLKTWLKPNPIQKKAVMELAKLQVQLTHKTWWQRFIRPKKVQQGLYLWGEVGRGKTYLMDLFFISLELNKKGRWHFHVFMRKVHEQLKVLREAHQSDPIPRLADQLAAEYEVICFDELFINDIGDAMIIGPLFQALLERGVVMVMTSNVAPANLYKDGLKRELLLPAINSLQTHLRVVCINGDEDYRYSEAEDVQRYFSPLKSGEVKLAKQYAELTEESAKAPDFIDLCGRQVRVVAQNQKSIWFNFDVLCGFERSQLDYLQLVKSFTDIFISDVPALTNKLDDQARRFINLVDICYDHQIKLYISAAVKLDALYQGERLAFEFSRTRSRIREMQTKGYGLS